MGVRSPSGDMLSISELTRQPDGDRASRVVFYGAEVESLQRTMGLLRFFHIKTKTAGQRREWPQPLLSIHHRTLFQVIHEKNRRSDSPFLKLHVECESPNFVGEHIKTGRGAGFERILAFHHRLVDLGTAFHVVTLDGQ